MTSPRWRDILATGLLLTGASGDLFGQQPWGSAPIGAGPGPILLPSPPAVAKGRPGLFAKAAARGSVLHPAEWPTPPLGATVDLHFQTHITNAAVGRMALYDYDFIRGSDQLNLRGRDRVRQLAGLFGNTTLPIVVERTPHAPELAEKRRWAVLAELTPILGHVPAERVVVGVPLPVPLQGVEAELIYMNLLELTGSAGVTPGTGVRGGTGGATGGGTTGIGGNGTGFPTGR